MKEVNKMKEPKGLPQHIASLIKMEDSALCKSVAAVTNPQGIGVLRSSSQYN